MVSTPPQHGKSSLFFSFIARELAYRPRQILYITYSADFANTQMWEARPIAERAGVQFLNENNTEWHTANGGKLTATGIGGRITGQPGKLIIIDDPIKDWAEAQSRTVRDYVDTWLRSSVMTRLHPDSSVILVMTRWHEDDLAGRFSAEGWDTVNLPAINDAGQALWPEGRPIEFLESQRNSNRVGPDLFEAMYQGRPRRQGSEIFGEPTWCGFEDVPVSGAEGFGLDLAYTAKTSADASVLLFGRKRDGVLYVLDCIEKQMRAEDFVDVLKAQQRRSPHARMLWYRSGTEKGSAGLIRRFGGVNIAEKDANRDKRVRAQFASAAWNLGKIVVPRDAPWAARFVSQVRAFTGNGSERDDHVDALAALWDLLDSEPATKSKVTPLRPSRVRSVKGLY